MKVLSTNCYKVTCRNCHSTLVFNKGDVKENWLGTDRWVVCPICKKKRHLGALCLYQIEEGVE